MSLFRASGPPSVPLLLSGAREKRATDRAGAIAARSVVLLRADRWDRGRRRRRCLWLASTVCLLVGSVGPGAAARQESRPPLVTCEGGGACSLDSAEPASGATAPPGEGSQRGTLSFYWGVGCAHCEDARPFLERLARERPGLHVEAIEVRADRSGRQRFIERMRRIGAPVSGIPTFVVGDHYLVGFTPGVSEEPLRQLVDDALEEPGAAPGAASDVVETKWFGRLSASELGLPLFTLAIGLLDGFNPCAMWVLLFLLAMLAGQRDRTRMALTAGTFVLVSGAIYFVFMAAWLGVFLVVGVIRKVQIVLGGIALGIGGLNLKDFFAFGRGPSLSIPKSAKPGIYARVRAVLREHSLAESMLGVAVLAVLVNLVELLCTAGLPAIYTSVLARHELSTAVRLAYIGLYNLGYIADDAAMVTLAVVTLSRRRLAERAGRWLKLVSALVMLALGGLLLFRPEWLP